MFPKLKKRIVFRILNEELEFSEEWALLSWVEVRNISARQFDGSEKVTIQKVRRSKAGERVETTLRVTLPFEEIVEEALFALSVKRPLGEVCFPLHSSETRSIEVGKEETHPKMTEVMKKISEIPNGIEGRDNKLEETTEFSSSFDHYLPLKTNPKTCDLLAVAKNASTSEKKVLQDSFQQSEKTGEEKFSESEQLRSPLFTGPTVESISSPSRVSLRTSLLTCWNTVFQYGKIWTSVVLKRSQTLVRYPMIRPSSPNRSVPVPEVLGTIDPQKVTVKPIRIRSPYTRVPLVRKWINIGIRLAILSVGMFFIWKEVQLVQKQFSHVIPSSIACQLLLQGGFPQKAQECFPEYQQVIERELQEQVQQTNVKAVKEKLTDQLKQIQQPKHRSFRGE